MDVRNQIWNARTNVNQEIWQLHERHHKIEKVCIVVKVAVAHHTHAVQVGCEDAGIFKDGAVLNDGVVTLADGDYVSKPLVEKVDLQVERPSCHVGIEIVQIRIVVYWLKLWYPIISFGKHGSEGCLAASYVSSNGYVHDECVFVV